MKNSKFHNFIQRIEKASYRWNEALTPLSSIFILASMLLVVADVSGRYLLNKPIMGAVEIEQIMLAYIAFFALSYALTKKTHVRMRLILNMFPQRVQWAAEVFAGLAGIFLFVLLIWGGVEQFWRSWVVREIMPAAIKLPYWLAKLSLPVGAFLVTVQYIIYTLHYLILFSKGEQE